jgi:serine protease Do
MGNSKIASHWLWRRQMTAFDRTWRKWAAAASVAFILTGGQVTAARAQQMMQLPSLADEAEKLLPAVVDISTSQKVAQGTGPQLPELPPNSPFKEFFDEFMNRQRRGENGQQEQRSVTSLGSGFVIDASGIVITNNHVVEGADEISVNFTDGTTLKAELIGRDPKVDLAVLRVKPTTPLVAVKFGDSDKLRIGDWVLAIGNPFGLGGSVSLGIVSARNRDINAGPYDDFIQTDAAINKGNSGGPLFNLEGDVVGINTAIYSPSGGSVGIGFSVPANTAKGVVEQLIKFGETRRGWLGVRIQQVTPDLIESLGLDRPRGALVADVTPEGPAAKAGIMAGDVVVEFNNRPIKEMKDLPRIVADTPIGQKVPVKVMRKGKEVMVSAEIGRLEDGEKQVAATGGDVPVPSTVDTLGMTLSPLNDQLRAQFNIDKDVNGAVVTAIDPSGPAAEKRLEPGDVITEAGEKAVGAPGDVEARVKDAERDKKNSILLLVAKGGKQGEMRFIALKLKKG